MEAVNLFKKYETDSKKENEGVEINIDGAVFVCRRAGGGNRRYRFAVADAATQLNEQLNSKDDETVISAEDEVTLRAFADAVVIDWRGVADRQGQPWPFSKENFLDLMHACPDVWTMLRVRARDVESFRIAEVKAAGETLGNGSSGNDSGENTSNA